jgi:predicted RNA-binding Zn-ribbon protein involved in translation (DUF1610 family)
MPKRLETTKMLSKIFLRIIESDVISKFVQSKGRIIQSTNPSRIYVENVRSFFGIPTSMARLLCSMAVKARFFNHRIGFLCNNCSSIIVSYADQEQQDEMFTCEKCEFNEVENYHFKRKDLSTIDFYELVERESV